MTTVRFGEERPHQVGDPARESVWPVLVDGREAAEIVETERGYRLREGGAWVAPERFFRATVGGDAYSRYLAWSVYKSHPASGTRYETAENGTEALTRVTAEGVVVSGPTRDERVTEFEYNRRYNESIKEIDA